MYFPILIKWMCPFPILGLLGGIFHFFSNLKETSVSKHWRTWPMSHKKDAIGLYGLIEQEICVMGSKNKLLSMTSCFYAPAIYNGGGGHIASPLSVRPYVCLSVRTYVPYVRKMVSRRYLLNTLVYWIHISYTGI